LFVPVHGLGHFGLYIQSVHNLSVQGFIMYHVEVDLGHGLGLLGCGFARQDAGDGGLSVGGEVPDIGPGMVWA
jgi:hypothetical protein